MRRSAGNGTGLAARNCGARLVSVWQCLYERPTGGEGHSGERGNGVEQKQVQQYPNTMYVKD